MQKEIKDFILMWADNSMILGQRLGEWCGHGPVLEQDIALTNIALDLIGEARNLYQYLAENESKQEDDYPMLRDVRAFKNVLLVEQPNGDWAETMMRQFMFDCWHYYFVEELTKSNESRLASVAKKTLKEVSYHLDFSSEWILRLGDGTEVSHQKAQDALEKLIPYFDELFKLSDYEQYCFGLGIGPDSDVVKMDAFDKFHQIVTKSTLTMPEKYFHKYGGKTGIHTEHLGFIIADMQFMQRAYPGVTW